MALYHDPKSGKTVEAKNSKEAFKTKAEAKSNKSADAKTKSAKAAKKEK